MTDYNTSVIFELLTEAFDPADLWRLCRDTKSLRHICRRVNREASLNQMADEVIAYCEQHASFDALLHVVHAARPRQYERFAPRLGFLVGDEKPPFKGLQAFGEEDADLFFGRETLVAKLASRLRVARFLAVVGASGSGKSSVVRAGLVPTLKRGQPLQDGTAPPEGSMYWPIHIITPTAHPLKELAISLTGDVESPKATAELIDDMIEEDRSLDLYIFIHCQLRQKR